MSTAFICLVIAIVVTIVFMFVFLAKLIYAGKRIRSEWDPKKKKELTPLHVEQVHYFFWSVILAFIFVKLMVFEQGGRLGDPLAYMIHFPFDVASCTIFFLMRFFITGENKPGLHVKLSKYFFVSFAGTVITGFVLMMQVLLKH